MSSNINTSLLRFVTMGSVDDGKSTLLGRMLYDSGNLPEDQQKALDDSTAGGLNVLPDFSLITDGLLAEQEQKITIDVAYRYFRTGKRVFILADSPGHEQYTRNMATAASTAHVALLLVDARNGITTQTRRHAFIASLLGIQRIVLLVNKMDLVDYSEQRYQEIVDNFQGFSTQLQFAVVHAIPVSALQGDNVARRSEKMDWYSAEPLLAYLEGIYIGSDTNPIDFRYPIQYVIRPNQDYRGFAGQILSGRIRVGDEVMILPSKVKSKVKSIDQFSNNKLESIPIAQSPQSITIRLDSEVDASRGDMIVRVGNLPRIGQEIESMLVWFGTEPLSSGKQYLVLHCGRYVKVRVNAVRYRIDVNTYSRQEATSFEMNDIGRVAISCHEPLYFDPYQQNKGTGSFVLIDSDTYATIAAGMIIDRGTATGVSTDKNSEPRSENLHDEFSELNRSHRAKTFGHPPLTLWFTGLSGSGKSSICRALELALFKSGKRVFWLDGDSVRKGLCRDLGFSAEERSENLRRVAEVAKLFNDAGTIVLCSFITPLHRDQELVRSIVGEGAFRLIYLSTPLEICEKRDPHGLYGKARAGEIKGFTGIGSPYEAPEKVDLELPTHSLDLNGSVETTLAYVAKLIED